MRLNVWLLIIAMSSVAAVRADDDALEDACFTAIEGDKLSTDVIIRSEHAGQVVTLHVISKDRTITYECAFLAGDASLPQLISLVMISEDGSSQNLPVDKPNSRISERLSR